MMAMSGAKVEPIYLMLAAAIDRLSLLWWANTEDARKGKNKPQMLVELLTAEKTESKGEYHTFNSGEDFEKMRNEIIQRGNG